MNTDSSTSGDDSSFGSLNCIPVKSDLLLTSIIRLGGFNLSKAVEERQEKSNYI